jgi:hypothetical protein
MRLKESINQNQINLLKATYGDIKKINPNSPAVKKLMMALKKLSKDDLETLSKAKINFVSTMAQSILRDSNVSESVNEADLNWNAVQNAIINFLKMNTKILDKKVQAKDTEGVKGGLKSIISGLTNAQRSLNLESVNEASYTVKAENPYQFVNGAYAVLSAYLKDAELGPKGKRELQDIIKSLDYMRKYFYFKMSESVNEAELPKDGSTIKVGNTRVEIKYVGKNKDYVGFNWKGDDGKSNYEETKVSDHKDMNSLINTIKDEIRHQRVVVSKRKTESVNEDVNFRDGKYRFYSKQDVGYLTYDGREISSGDFDWEDGSNSYWMYHSSWRGQKAFDTGKDVIAYFKSKKITTESVNEAKYPTDLKIGSVILGQGFTMLKGIEGGRYYKIVDMDDFSATLVPSDKNGNVKGSNKVRHKLDSIEGGIKTAKRGDENGIVVIKESAKKSTFIKVARISNNGKLDIY